MIKLKSILFESMMSSITPKDIFIFYYLDYVIHTNPGILKHDYVQEIFKFYLGQIQSKYHNFFRALLYSQLVKYTKDVRPNQPLQKGRVDADFDVSKLKPDAPTSVLRDLMNKTFRSDMKRRNDVWNAVADYTYKLESTSINDVMVGINGLNNAVHNTNGKILTDHSKVSNAPELIRAFETADKIKNRNQWEILKGMVPRDVQDILSHGEIEE